PAAKDAHASVLVNALFPHQLAGACKTIGARLIHLSTDCVFTGRRGRYRESDASDAEDIYGRTKWLGELHHDHCLTIRTSMIGRELAGTHGLVEWFLSQRGQTVRGFQKAVFSGLTTTALSNTIANVITENKNLHGVWHVAGDAINKLDLLRLVKQAFQVEVEIEPDQTFVCDRSLDDTRFRSATGFKPPTWEEMIEEMARDQTPYEEIRRTHADR
ncbi:MAG TPA: SDR family oxidoreductase, partial [Pyrinomonadaceae bacterium]